MSKSTAAVHSSPPSCPIAGLCAFEFGVLESVESAPHTKPGATGCSAKSSRCSNSNRGDIGTAGGRRVRPVTGVNIALSARLEKHDDDPAPQPRRARLSNGPGVQEDLKSLRLFVAVADAGSLSGGAQRLSLALGAASRRIAEVERCAGVALFKRHARGVSATAAGDAFLLDARTVLSALDRLDAELGEFRRGIKGQVTVAANASTIAGRLPADLGAFLTLHPDLRIDLEERSSTGAVSAVAQGVCDIGIFEAGTPAHELERFDYCADRLVVLVARGHAVARRRRISVTEVLAYDMVALHEGTSLFRTLSAAALAAGVPLRLRMRVRRFDAMCRMVEQGIGVGVLPEAAIAPQLAAMRLRAVALDAPWAERRHLIGVRSMNALPVAAQSLLRHLTGA